MDRSSELGRSRPLACGPGKSPFVIRKHSTLLVFASAALASAILPCVSAEPIIPSPAYSGTEFHFEAGLIYVSGAEKVVDQLEQNFGLERKSSWPVGIKLAAYTKYSNGFAFGASVGPFAFIEVDDNNHYGHNDNTKTSYIIPASFDVRYFFAGDESLASYVRLGISYPISGGDYVGSGTAGPVGAVGVHFWQHRTFALGLEAGYDGSQVEVKTGYFHGAEKVRPVGFAVSLFASF